MGIEHAAQSLELCGITQLARCDHLVVALRVGGVVEVDADATGFVLRRRRRILAVFLTFCVAVVLLGIEFHQRGFAVGALVHAHLVVERDVLRLKLSGALALIRQALHVVLLILSLGLLVNIGAEAEIGDERPREAREGLLVVNGVHERVEIASGALFHELAPLLHDGSGGGR